MRVERICILLLVLFFIDVSAFAQQDSTIRDSTELYKHIETYSKRRKFTQFMYGLVFKPVAPIPKNKIATKKVNKRRKQKPYSAFEGKIIRAINIETLDPFGYTIGDTIYRKQNILSKTGNEIHIKSQNITIRNLLLIRRNQPFDSLLVKESERLIRNQSYVQDVVFFVTSVTTKSDSVDIYIRILDNWSITPQVSGSATRFSINITDKNLVGLGHEFQNQVLWNHQNGNTAFNTSYFIPNFRNTYINSKLHYGIDEYKNSTKSFTIDRPFFSPFAKWAAGLLIAQHFKKDSLNVQGSGFLPIGYKFNTQDFWAGSARQIFSGNSENERTTNLILTGRYLRIRYINKPSELYDPLHIYSHEDFYLASVGISTRKFVQDRYIFNYGLTEDVPEGKIYSLTGGYQVKNNKGRFYLGLRYSTGNFNNWGYLSFNFEYGTFFNGPHAEQGHITAGANYFTELLEIGKWKFRQFIKPEVIFGINRFSYDSLTLNDGFGLDGFNSFGLTGHSRLLFSLQTQVYAPWNWIGFRFGPYFVYSVGMLGNADRGFRDSRLYSQLGLGVLIKNDNLVLNTFQVSISFYPLIPGKGANVIKLNSYNTTDFGFRDFEIGKPGSANFR